MTATVHVEIGHRSAYFAGHHALVVPAIKAARSPRQYDGQRRCWSVPVAFADDIIAALEVRAGVDVHLTQVDR